jgi:hypothetical protein
LKEERRKFEEEGGGQFKREKRKDMRLLDQQKIGRKLE